MLDACPVHPKGTMVIPMLWRIIGYVVCMMGVKNQNHHTHPYVKSACRGRRATLSGHTDRNLNRNRGEDPLYLSDVAQW